MNGIARFKGPAMTDSFAELARKGLKKVAWAEHEGWTTEVYAASGGAYAIRQYRRVPALHPVQRPGALFRKLPELLPAAALAELAGRFALALMKGGIAS
jgi:hypothetical protein